MSLTVNPCKACMTTLQADGKCDYQSINNCCYKVLAAAKGTDSNQDLREVQNCIECVRQQMPCLPGLDRGPCNVNPKPPPIWNQSERYFFPALRESHNPQHALQQCMKECKENALYKEECMQNCQLDYASVEQLPAHSVSPAPIVPAGDNKWAFWIAFVVVALILSTGLAISLQGILKR